MKFVMKVSCYQVMMSDNFQVNNRTARKNPTTWIYCEGPAGAVEMARGDAEF
ncbi:hypothetical protein SAMN04487911_10164 [Arenibacter nanhaiticus]|uniref:Uncharacterized protein n=1 Tax=Arenibacter nanhaiticus TaxID=558155 RepID=A0A1M6A4I1_9FLAO|nr:hypothetical protein SAMN04487911_10164 [Arenibacter nanhaiticus]